MKNIFKQVWQFIKNLLKRFVLDSNLLEIGIDRIIKVILESSINGKMQFYKYSKRLVEVLKNEFGNIKPINRIIDIVVESINDKSGEESSWSAL